MQNQQSIKVTYTLTKQISSCWYVCPYFTLGGGVMVCSHPEAEDEGYIIEHPKCRNGFPDKCPLLKEE